MKGFCFISILSVAALIFVTCQGENDNLSNTAGVVKNNSIAPETRIPYPSVQRISLEEAKADFDAGKAVFIDTHSEASFAHEHIEGAINVPTMKVDEKFDSIPKNKKIIAYCS